MSNWATVPKDWPHPSQVSSGCRHTTVPVMMVARLPA